MNDADQQTIDNFLFMFRVRILYCFWDVAKYCSKIEKFYTLPVFYALKDLKKLRLAIRLLIPDKNLDRCMNKLLSTINITKCTYIYCTLNYAT